MALTDAAPLIAAEAQGFFARAGLQVELHREIGWATIRDKIIYGELDAAQAPAPMLWSAQLGIHCPPCEVLTALVLNLHGNAITLSRTLWDSGARDNAALRLLARERRRRQPLTFGVVFPFSSHHLQLRSWLRAAGIDPDRDVRIVIVPPAQVFRNLSAGTIDGFCAGEPWNTVAAQAGLGWCVCSSAQQEPGHVEKVLIVTRNFAEDRATEHAALVGALAEACAWCDESSNRTSLAELLSGPRALNLPVQAIAPSLLDVFTPGIRPPETIRDFHVFHGHDANVPTVAKAVALQQTLADAGLLAGATLPAGLPAELFREDLYSHIVQPCSHSA